MEEKLKKIMVILCSPNPVNPKKQDKNEAAHQKMKKKK